MSNNPWSRYAETLTRLLSLEEPPLAITFSNEAPAGVPTFDDPMPSPTDDGRTGRVPAGCVFWIKAAERTFVTAPDDHGNCSVGSLTHGLKTIEEVKDNSDVCAVLEAGWVTPEIIPEIPVVAERHAHITYGPLAETPVDPDVAFLRLNAKQAMILHNALPEMRFEGKPQCHIVAIAKERGEAAVSVGCMLSRVRTGMPASQMTCALPARQLGAIVDRLETTCGADRAVAEYAAEDTQRFES